MSDDDAASARASLVRLLQMAHAGEPAAAYAYRGHWRSLEEPQQRAEVRRIETAEGHHRHVVAGLLAEETRHESWFGDRVRGQRLLPVARLAGRWSPPER